MQLLNPDSCVYFSTLCEIKTCMVEGLQCAVCQSLQCHGRFSCVKEGHLIALLTYLCICNNNNELIINLVSNKFVMLLHAKY